MNDHGRQEWLEKHGRYREVLYGGPMGVTGEWYSHNGSFLHSTHEHPITDLYDRVKDLMFSLCQK